MKLSVDHFLGRHWLACLLLALHTVLIAAVGWVQLDNGWDDMNPTFLLLLGFQSIDAPIHWLLRPLIDVGQLPGTYLAATMVLGGLFWFALGSLLSFVGRGLRHLLGRSRQVTDVV
jgi:hypothetical protein